MTTTRNRPARPGFTLIEILVVMSLIILLAALALGVSQSGMFGSQKVISGGDRASGWLLIAKQRAMRDGLPRGVRFFNTVGGVTGNANAFTEAAYIEQPDAWVPNPQQEGKPNGPRIVFCVDWTPNANPAFNTVNSVKCYFVSGPAVGPPNMPNTWPVDTSVTNDILEFDQRVVVGDQLVVPELGKNFRIDAVATTGSGGLKLPGAGPGNPVTTVDPNAYREIRLTSINVPYPAIDINTFSAAGTQVVAGSSPGTLTTYKYGFQKPPQPLLGEPALQLTGGISIDFREGPNNDSSSGAGPYNPSTTTGVKLDPTKGYFDILFSPSGQVLNNNAGIVCLWVRETAKAPHPRFDTAGAIDTPKSFDQAGPQVLIVLNTRNGLISTQPINAPVNPAAYDPYQFAKDGINSGL